MKKLLDHLHLKEKVGRSISIASAIVRLSRYITNGARFIGILKDTGSSCCAWHLEDMRASRKWIEIAERI